MLVPVVISSVFTALFAVSTYLPYNTHIKLHAPSSAETKKGSLNLHECALVKAPGLAFCDDIALHEPSGMAYVTCDPSRLWFDPMRGLWEAVPPHAPQELHDAAGIWAWDTRIHDSQPQKLPIEDFPSRGAFHPLAVAVTNLDPLHENATNPQSLLLLVSTQPEAGRAAVVDVLVHTLHPHRWSDLAESHDPALESVKPRSPAQTLRHHLRLGPDHFMPERAEGQRGTGKPLSPYRLAVFREQYSPLLPSDHELQPGEEAQLVAVPSFFFSALPDPTSFNPSTSGRNFHAAAGSYWGFVQRLLQPGKYASPPKGLFLYNARAALTGLVLPGVHSWPGFAPVPKSWDGGGDKAGYNSSAAIVATLDTGSEETAVHEWEQHWVRGIEGGLAYVQDPYQAYKDALEGIPSEEESGVAPPVRRVATYMPSFVNFWSRRPSRPASAMGLDDWGRYWTAGSSSSLELDMWIGYLRNLLQDPLNQTWTQSLTARTRPGTSVEQSTYVWRQGNQVAHPWEYSRMREVRERGILIPKEFAPASVFRSKPSGNEWEPLSVSIDDPSIQFGFLPTAPSGLAVNREQRYVYITGAYDERGIAKCHIPEDWAEL